MSEVVIGEDRLVARLKDFRRKHSTALVRGLKKGGQILKRATVPFIPREEGSLAKSLQVRAFQEGGKDVVEVSMEAEYAGAVHNIPPSRNVHGAEYNIKHAADIAKRKKYWYKGKMKRYHRRKPLESHQFLTLAWKSVAGQVRQAIIDEVKK